MINPKDESSKSTPSGLQAMRVGLVIAGTLLLASCGGGSSTPLVGSADGTGLGNNPSQSPSMQDDVPGQDPANPAEGPQTGVLTLLEREWLGDEVAMIDYELPDRRVVRAGSGSNPWRHPNGQLVHTVGCGRLVNRVQVLNPDGSTDILTPCSSEFDSPGILSREFYYSQLSPSSELLAVEARWFTGDNNYRSDVWIFRDSEVVDTIENAFFPTWVDDETLILTGAGLYRYQIGGTPELINEDISTAVGVSDVSPDGTQIVFGWNQQIWTSDLNGENRRELVTGNQHYVDPVWSPDGQFVAYLSTGDAFEETVINYVTVADGSGWVSQLESQLGTANRVTGPLSWID